MSVTESREFKKFIRYKMVRLPGKHRDVASRQAVLFPLTGRLRKRTWTHEELKQRLGNKCIKLIYMWRRRLLELQKANWYKLVQKSNSYLFANCHPSLMHAKPQGLICKQTAICPFCYARNMQNLYIKIYNVCKAIPNKRKNEYMLLGFVKELAKPKTKDNKLSISAILKAEVDRRRKLVNELGKGVVQGSYLTSTVEPIDNDRWLIKRRGIMLVSSDLDYKPLKLGKTKCITQFNGDRLARLLGWLLRYPELLMTSPDTNRVVQYLQAKQKYRLGSPTGSFRKQYELPKPQVIRLPIKDNNNGARL